MLRNGGVHPYRWAIHPLLVSLCLGAIGLRAAAVSAHAAQHALERVLAQGKPDAPATVIRERCELCVAFDRKTAAAPAPELFVDHAPLLEGLASIPDLEPVAAFQPLPPARAPPARA